MNDVASLESDNRVREKSPLFALLNLLLIYFFLIFIFCDGFTSDFLWYARAYHAYR